MVSPWWSGSVGITNYISGAQVNVPVPAGRKGKVLAAVIMEPFTPMAATDHPIIKFGGSSGVGFTERVMITTTYGEAQRMKLTIATYDDDSMTTGTVAIHCKNAIGTMIVFIIRGAEYANQTSGTGTSTSNSRTSALRRGGIVIGAMCVETTGGISELNGVSELADALDGSRYFLYMKNGAQDESVTGGGSWSGSHKYIHARVAFNALGKEYM
jgi:hypothetical protein